MSPKYSSSVSGRIKFEVPVTDIFKPPKQYLCIYKYRQGVSWVLAVWIFKNCIVLSRIRRFSSSKMVLLPAGIVWFEIRKIKGADLLPQEPARQKDRLSLDQKPDKQKNQLSGGCGELIDVLVRYCWGSTLQNSYYSKKKGYLWENWIFGRTSEGFGELKHSPSLRHP